MIVTNKHVIEGSVYSDFYVHVDSTPPSGGFDQGNHPSGKFKMVRVVNSGTQWIEHPDLDLCGLPVATLLSEMEKDGEKAFYRPLYDNLIAPQERLDLLSAVEDVLMVGYPNGLWDETHNLPLIRKGVTASHPAIDFKGEPFGVVDAGCFPGSSGSPILILNEGTFSEEGIIRSGKRIIFLGILFAGPQFDAKGGIEIVSVPSVSNQLVSTLMPMHLGFYVKAKAMFDLQKVALSKSCAHE